MEDDWFLPHKANAKMSRAAYEAYKASRLRIDPDTRMEKPLKQTHDMQLQDESFFVCRGYPSLSDWKLLAERILTKNLKNFEEHMTWLTKGTTETPMDVLLAIWLSVSTNCEDTQQRTLKPAEKLKLANTIWKKGPDVNLRSYGNLQNLTCTCAWTAERGLEKILEGYTYLREPVFHSCRRMKDDYEKIV